MIRVTIRKAALRAGVENAYQLQKRAGLSPAVAADLWRGEKLPRLETLDKLCDVLGCQLCDLVTRNGHTRAAPQKQAGRLAGKKR